MKSVYETRHIMIMTIILGFIIIIVIDRYKKKIITPTI